MAKSCLVHLALLLLLSSSSAIAHGGAKSYDKYSAEERSMERRESGAAGEEVTAGEAKHEEHVWAEWRRYSPRGGPGRDTEPNTPQQRSGERTPQQGGFGRRHALTPEPAHGGVRARSPEITPAPSMPRCRTPRDALGLARRQEDGRIQALSQQIRSISEVANSVSQASRQVSQSSQQLSQSVQQLTQTTSRLSQSLQEMQQSARQAGESAAAASRSADQAVASAARSATEAMSASLAAMSSSLIAAASQSAQQIMQQAQSRVQAAQSEATLARTQADNQVEVQRAQGLVLTVTQAALLGVGVFLGTSLLAVVAFFLIIRHRRRKRGGDDGAIGYPRDAKASSHRSFGSLPGDVSQPAPALAVPVIGSAPPGNNIGRAYSLSPPAARREGGGDARPASSTFSRGSFAYSPSLQQWLKAGVVSPFGALTKAEDGGEKGTAGKRASVASAASSKKSPNWPFGIKAGRAGASLPLRNA